MPQEELDEALKQLALELVAGLQVAIANVALVAEAGVGEDVAVELPQGQRVVLREVPVASGRRVCAGRARAYPSTVVMGVVTARAAGVIDVAVCAPPGPDGQIDPVILGACRLCGVERVYRMGGAQAIAALAYGTETVRRVDVIVGPGNLYVQEAKRPLSATRGDRRLRRAQRPAGRARRRRRRARGRAGRARHARAGRARRGQPRGGASHPQRRRCDALGETIERARRGAPDGRRRGLRARRVRRTREAAIELANAFAPEHLQLIGAEPEALAPHGALRRLPVRRRRRSATAFGDYVAGSNHVLPTGGAARFASTLSPRHFRRRMAEVRLGPSAATRCASWPRPGAPIARAEGFEVHAESMVARVRENQGS